MISSVASAALFTKVENYLISKHLSSLPHCELIVDRSDVRLGFNNKTMKPMHFEDQLDAHKIWVSVQNEKENERLIVVESRTASVDDLRRYVISIGQEAKRRQVTIESEDNAIYSKLEEYMVGKHLEKMRTCSFIPKNGEVTISVNSASFERSLQEPFQTHPITMTMVPIGTTGTTGTTGVVAAV
jgi:hypothetical protein